MKRGIFAEEPPFLFDGSYLNNSLQAGSKCIKQKKKERKVLMARQFGIITTVSGITSVVVTSFSEKQNVQIAEARDSRGQITDLKAYSLGVTVHIKGYLDNTACDVQAGDTLELGGRHYIIESISRNETNTAYAEVDITGRSADSAEAEKYPHPVSGE